MRAFDPEVVDAVWAGIEPFLPARPADTHPLGCHRPRVSDRICFEAILVRLVTGCAWVDAEALCGGRVSDTTLRARRDEWVTAGVFDQLAAHALAAYDRIIGLDLTDAAMDGSTHKAPCGGQGTGKNPTDRGKLGWKWSILTDRAGIPVGWATDGANRHDTVLVPATFEAAERFGLLEEIDTLHLDRGYGTPAMRHLAATAGIDDVICPTPRPAGTAKTKLPVPLGLRWPVERTNSWLSNYGQLRRNTDRHPTHRLAQLALATTILITAKLIDWRNKYTP